MGILVGIGHKKRRGKDTAANRLVDKHGFVRVSWADALKEACRLIFHFNNEQLYGNLKEKVDPRWGRTPRWILQTFGTEACRDNIDTDIWVKSAWLRIEAIWKDNPQQGIVVPDVRFVNEANFIKEKGGVLWRVDREIPDDENSNHPSETSLDGYDKWDQTLNNNSDLRNLYGGVDSALETARTPAPRRKRRGIDRR